MYGWLALLLSPLVGFSIVVFPETDFTLAELRLLASNPKEALVAYFAQVQAKRSVAKMFGTNEEGDQSDAVRHYLWAGLMVRELGERQATTFLNAHETQTHENVLSRQMDLTNNREGVRAATLLLSKQRLTLKALEQEALKDLRSKRLLVIIPRAGPFQFEGEFEKNSKM